MNEWILAAIVLLVAGLVPVGIAMLTGDVMSAAAAFGLAGPLCSVILLLLAEGFHRQPFVDLAVVLSVVSSGGSLVLARFLEWGA
ncbi:MAG TPA: monovalent cation/H+ antiporter complex subunit F [Solirubrobacteraceae bacterium]|nr:monovalent cation/H+ antiporter complex subunit F [Solirubrobacteraceae bacterium]